MNKETAYQKLVEKRKQFSFRDQELTNPSETLFDCKGIEPWSQWQNNLNAKILLIGQEFCDLDTYNKDQGKIELEKDVYAYPSNRNLNELFSSIGIEIGHPLNPNHNAPVFFTNAVMGLKNGSMSSNFKDKWLKESQEEFLVPLIEIIQPEIIITLGGKAYQSISTLYNQPVMPLGKRIDHNPLITDGGVKLFAFFHPGKLGTINRSFELQKQDWQTIVPYLKQ